MWVGRLLFEIVSGWVAKILPNHNFIKRQTEINKTKFFGFISCAILMTIITGEVVWDQYFLIEIWVGQRNLKTN